MITTMNGSCFPTVFCDCNRKFASHFLPTSERGNVKTKRRQEGLANINLTMLCHSLRKSRWGHCTELAKKTSSKITTLAYRLICLVGGGDKSRLHTAPADSSLSRSDAAAANSMSRITLCCRCRNKVLITASTI